MESALGYMARMHPTLSRNYRDLDGSLGRCNIVARDIAKLLEKEGKQPYIAIVHGNKWENITPKPFEGRISWVWHLVCCVDDKVYDPMISTKPVSAEDYCGLAFDGKVEVKIWQ